MYLYVLKPNVPWPACDLQVAPVSRRGQSDLSHLRVHFSAAVRAYKSLRAASQRNRVNVHYSGVGKLRAVMSLNNAPRASTNSFHCSFRLTSSNHASRLSVGSPAISLGRKATSPARKLIEI